jgi:hypothetical protein
MGNGQRVTGPAKLAAEGWGVLVAMVVLFSAATLLVFVFAGVGLNDGLFLPSSCEAPATEFAARARATWARLIRKVYEADPLECPQCKGPMRVIALIEDPGVIRRILEHLGLWAPLATERSPPPGAANWPRHANLPLTYHPVPEIA